MVVTGEKTTNLCGKKMRKISDEQRLQRPGIVAVHLLVSEIIVKLSGWSLVSWLDDLLVGWSVACLVCRLFFLLVLMGWLALLFAWCKPGDAWYAGGCIPQHERINLQIKNEIKEKKRNQG